MTGRERATSKETPIVQHPTSNEEVPGRETPQPRHPSGDTKKPEFCGAIEHGPRRASRNLRTLSYPEHQMKNLCTGRGVIRGEINKIVPGFSAMACRFGALTTKTNYENLTSTKLWNPNDNRSGVGHEFLPWSRSEQSHADSERVQHTFGKQFASSGDVAP